MDFAPFCLGNCIDKYKNLRLTQPFTFIEERIFRSATETS
jgi:hypothetical protein